MLKKIGFWSVFAIVLSSQVGSGILVLPVALSPFGFYSVLGWIFSGLGALSLALVFAGLCHRFPKTGGPHVYIQAVFGKTAAFFTGWTYWVISWFSSTVVVIASIGYLSPFIGDRSPHAYLILEIFLVAGVTALNLKGISSAGRTGLILTLLKALPLLILPIASFWYFDTHHFVMETQLSQEPLPSILAQVTLLTLWGFIGLESATTSAGSVINPQSTIPKAIFFGTLCAAILYLINSLGIMGLLPTDVLSRSKAPYIDAANALFGGQWHLIIAVIASIICIGTLNAWMLTSGQIALGLAEDRLLPSAFAKKNKRGAPVYGLVLSCIGIVPFLWLMMEHSIAKQLATLIDDSVTAFLFIYLFCGFAYCKILLKEKAKFYHWIYTIIGMIFSLWILYETDLTTLAIAAMFVLSGAPLYFIWYRKEKA